MKMIGWACAAAAGLVLAAAGDAQRRAPSTEPYVDVPFDTAMGGLVVVRAAMDGGEPGGWVLDSGASVCVVDAALAERRALRRAGRGSVSGAGAGRVAADTVREPVRVELGGRATVCERTVAIDLAGLTEPLRQRIDGILGFDFLRAHVVEIDYAQRRLRLHDPRSYRYAGSGARVPLQFRGRHPYVAARITVGHGPPVERTLLVDTGSGDAVDDSLLLHSPRPTRTVTGGVGLGSTYPVTSGFLDMVELGGFRFADVPGVAPGPALVGGAVLRRFTVILDYGRQEMILEPNRHFADPFGPS
jgi:hypothetical protein